MQSILRLAAAIGLVAGIASCSTSNVSPDPAPDWRQGSSFSVTTETGSGEFTPVLDVSPDGNGVVVTVKAQDASNLSAAYVHVAYDTKSFTPESVQVGSFLGGEGQTVSLALTNQGGDVPVGIAQIKRTGVTPVNGNGVLATIRFRNGGTNLRSISSRSPGGNSNKVETLIITNMSGTTADLQWTEKNTGDYDNNGEVTISDLTPVGIFFNDTVATSPDPDNARLVDGDGNGEINIADITPIGSNFGNALSGYILYTDPDGTVPMGSDITVLRADQDINPKKAVVYQYTAVFNPSDPPTFGVRPVSSTDMSNPGPLSNAAQIISDPGNPLAPTNLQVASSAIVGPGKLKLTWTASTSIDVSTYSIDRKLTSEDDSAWIEIGTVSSLTNTYTDTGLADNSYDYRVWSTDTTALKSAVPSAPASGTPFVLVVSPPENVTAVTSGSGAHAIDVSWDKPADNSAEKFRVYRKGPSDSDFVAVTTTVNKTITSYTDSDCTALANYEYYVVSLDISGAIESAPSPTVNANASADAPPISITDLTTSKWTHLQNGSEGAATLTVTTDVPADSVSWSASAGGNPSGSGNTASWAPTGNPPLGKVTITCTVTNVSGSDNATIDLIITDMPIKTNLGASGKAPDFTGSFMDAIASGGSITDRSFYSVIQGNVALVKEWESW